MTVICHFARAPAPDACHRLVQGGAALAGRLLNLAVPVAVCRVAPLVWLMEFALTSEEQMASGGCSVPYPTFGSGSDGLPVA